MFDELFIQAVRGIIHKEMNATITIGTVTSVNGNVCDVDRDNLPELVDVRLNAVQDELKSSLTIVPKVGSYVLCGFIEGKEEEAFVISTSEIEKIEIWFDADKTKGLTINADGSVFDKGDNSGVVKAPELETQLDKLTARVDGIIDAITNGVPIAQDGGIGYQSTMVTALNLLVDKEDFSNLENDRLKH